MTYQEKQALSNMINELPRMCCVPFRLAAWLLVLIPVLQMMASHEHYPADLTPPPPSFLWFAASRVGKLVQIIQERLPALRDAPADELEIDIDSLDPTTLRELERYVNSVLKRVCGYSIADICVRACRGSIRTASPSICFP